MTNRAKRHNWEQSHQVNPDLKQQEEQPESFFYYFAYGSCMCPVDLKRTLGENTHNYVLGAGILKAYRFGFYRYSKTRKCGVLDVVKDQNKNVQGVLYKLPWRLSEALDRREDVPSGGYRHEYVDISCRGKLYKDVRTYVVVNKLSEEIAPNDWYFSVVLRGAVTCGLSDDYCWNLFNHMYQLQQQGIETKINIVS
jgi:cation transport regulator ChaC